MNILKQHLLQIRDAALAAVDPGSAVSRSVHLQQGAGKVILRLGGAESHSVGWHLTKDERILLLAAGKAAAPMAQALMERCSDWVKGGLVVTKYQHAAGYTLPANIQVMEAGHPTPDQAGIQATEAILKLLGNARKDEPVIMLLSGGASALLPSPALPITLDELQQTTGLLLRCGASIVELNTLRKHLEHLKGGGLARAAWPAPVATLVLSDVVGDPLDVIASGPTVPDPTTFQEAWRILERYEVLGSVPASVRERLQAGLDGRVVETPKPGDPLFQQVTNLVIGSNRLAAQAAVAQAQALGYHSLLLSTFLEGEAREVGRVVAALAKGIRSQGDPFPPPACLVMGGETTVTVRGAGKGGRNQELALSAAIELAGVPEALVMALATDGGDGPTDAAGAIVNGNDFQRAREMGFDPYRALANNDAYPLLDGISALMRTGPTGTNVNDLIVILVGESLRH
jgi:glycerate 2-kinase